MNLGIYLENMQDGIQFDITNKIVSYAFDYNKVDDTSVFYDNLGPIPSKLKCGMFNSTDIWHFQGKLLFFSLNSVSKSLGIINNFELYYYMGSEKINVLQLLDLINKGLKIICLNKTAKKNLYRLTSQFPIGTSNRPDNILRYIME